MVVQSGIFLLILWVALSWMLLRNAHPGKWRVFHHTNVLSLADSGSILVSLEGSTHHSFRAVVIGVTGAIMFLVGGDHQDVGNRWLPFINESPKTG